MQAATPLTLGAIVDWAASHSSLIGWPALCLLAWRVSRFLTKAETRVLTAENHITKMATNCFPTMQTSLQNQDGLLKSVDQSLKTLVLYHEHPTKKH